MRRSRRGPLGRGKEKDDGRMEMRGQKEGQKRRRRGDGRVASWICGRVAMPERRDRSLGWEKGHILEGWRRGQKGTSEGWVETGAVPQGRSRVDKLWPIARPEGSVEAR